MQTFNNELLNSLNTYFHTVSKLGYVNYSEVDKLIVILFIGEILNGLFEEPINEEDYKLITNAVNCLHGTSCLLPYPKTNNGAKIGVFPNLLFPRITEQCLLRISESNNWRSIE